MLPNANEVHFRLGTLVSYHPSSTLPHSFPESQVEEDEFVGGDEDAAAGRRREVLGVAEAAVTVAKAGILLVNLLGNFSDL